MGLKDLKQFNQVLCSSSPNSVSGMSRRYVDLWFLSSDRLGTLLSTIINL